MFVQFLRLADATPASILEFARRWGVLQLCRHDLPISHMMRAPVWGDICLPSNRQLATGQYWEPMEPWRQFAAEAGALLKIAQAIRNSHASPPSDWKHVRDYEKHALFFASNKSEQPQKQIDAVAFDRRILSVAVRKWLLWGDVSVSFAWDTGETPLRIKGAGLFGNLAIYLMLNIVRSSGIDWCSSCGVPYFPPKRPQPNRRRYCDSCRDAQIPGRDAARAYRQRKKALLPSQ